MPCPPPLGRQALPALGPSTLERHAASSRAHPRAEPVNAGALALLWLVGALHLAVAGARPSSALVRKPRGQAPRRSSIGVHARAPPGRAARRSALGAPRACARRATCLRSPRATASTSVGGFSRQLRAPPDCRVGL